jgi:ABC-2 type transport system permease protein
MSAERSVPGLAGAAARIFALEWPGLLWGRRGRFLLPLLAWPVLSATMRLASGGRLAWTDCVGSYLDFLLPLVALFQATRLVRHHVEQRTIVYLLARPVSRPAILLGSFGAYLASALAVALPSIVIGFFLCAPIGGGAAESLLRALLASAAALASFGALFALLGLVLRKPLVFGLIVVFSSLVLAGTGGLFPRATLTAPLRVLAAAPSAPAGMTVVGAALGLTAFTVLALTAAIVAFRTGEYVPEA